MMGTEIKFGTGWMVTGLGFWNVYPELGYVFKTFCCTKPLKKRFSAANKCKQLLIPNS